MSRSRRATALAVLVPALTAGMVAISTPAGAIPYEGDPSPTHCLRIVKLAHSAPAGSPLFVSHGYVAILVPKAKC
jgi:hypothetical protein